MDIFDVLFVLICLANQTGNDLAQALENNLAKKTLRDAGRHAQNPKISDNPAAMPAPRLP